MAIANTNTGSSSSSSSNNSNNNSPSLPVPTNNNGRSLPSLVTASAVLSPGLPQPPVRSQRQQQKQHLDHPGLTSSAKFTPPGPPPPTIVLHTSIPARSRQTTASPTVISPSFSFSSPSSLLVTPAPTFSSTPSPPPPSPHRATLAPSSAAGSLSPRPASVLSQPSPTIPQSPPTFSASPPPLARSPHISTTTLPPLPHTPRHGLHSSPDYPTEPPAFNPDHYRQSRIHHPPTGSPPKPSKGHPPSSCPPASQQPHCLQGLGLVIEGPPKETGAPDPHHQHSHPHRLSLKQLPRAHIDPKTSLPSPPSSGHFRNPFSPVAAAAAAAAAASSAVVNEPSSPHSPSAKKANISPPFQTPQAKENSSRYPFPSQATSPPPPPSASFADQYAHHLQQKRPGYNMSQAAHPPANLPQYPSRQESQHYRTHTHFPAPPTNVSYYPPPPPPHNNNNSATTQSYHPDQLPQTPASPNAQQHGNVSREEYEEIEDRRRMQQQILRDKLLYAETHAPDPAMTVKTTTNHGFALGAFDMSESLAIVEDLLDYFGENEGALLDSLEADQFNQAELMEAERIHLQRESLIRHLYDSEEDYIRSLIDMSRYYRQPMLLMVQQAEQKKGTLSFGSSSAPKPIASKEEIQTLFGNLDELIRFHEGFRDALESRAKIWGPNQIISDLLMEVIPNFKVYTKYYTNFHGALTTLDRIMRLPHYKKFVEQCVTDNPPGTPSLHLMLATPLRRISTTREILASICQATQSNHPDYRNLINSYELFCKVSEQTRMDRLHAQDQLALFDIQSSMVSFPDPIMIPNRRLVLRADLHKVDSSLALEPRTYYLMNDVLLYARFDPRKNIYTFKGMFDLLYTQVNDPEDNSTLPQLPNSIQIANAGRKQMIRCRSREEKHYWMETLKQAIDVVNSSSDDPSAPLGDVLPLRKYATSIASDTTATLATFAGQSSVQGGSGIGAGGSTGEAGPSTLLGVGGQPAPSLAGGTTNHSMRSRAFSAFTNMTTSTAGMDTQSLVSKTSSTDSQGRPRPRRPNPQADFYGCSFGISFDVNLNEDNMPGSASQPGVSAGSAIPVGGGGSGGSINGGRSLSSALQSGNNVSTTSVGTNSSSGSTTGSSILQAGMRTQQPLGAMLASIPEDKLTPKQRKAKEALAKAVEARRQARLKEEAKRGKAVASSAASTFSNGSGGGGKDDATSRQVNPDFSSSFIPVKVRRDVVGK